MAVWINVGGMQIYAGLWGGRVEGGGESGVAREMDSAVNLNKCGGEWHRLIAGINHIFPAAAGYGLVDPSLSLVIHSQRADKNTKGINRVEPNLSLSLSLSLILSLFVSGSRFDLDSQNIPCPKWFKRKKEPRPPTLKKKKRIRYKRRHFCFVAARVLALLLFLSEHFGKLAEQNECS